MTPPRYDLHLKDGTTRTCLDDEQVAQLMRCGEIDRHSPCAVSGSSQWRTVDDLLPLLKWESRSSSWAPSEAYPDTRPYTGNNHAGSRQLERPAYRGMLA